MKTDTKQTLFLLFVLLTASLFCLFLGLKSLDINNGLKTKKYDAIKIVYYDKICRCEITTSVLPHNLTIDSGYFNLKQSGVIRKIESKNIRTYCHY